MVNEGLLLLFFAIFIIYYYFCLWGRSNIFILTATLLTQVFAFQEVPRRHASVLWES